LKYSVMLKAAKMKNLSGFFILNNEGEKKDE
jgi:hypothetical protein